MSRRRVCYEGRVQGVGFRAECCRIAGRFAVVGSVKNLPDGRVELLADGAEPEVEQFLAAIRTALGRFIRDEQIEIAGPGEPFSEFRVAY